MDLFALGGLKDEGGEIDEASGNRVPIGGTKEGVRDDIPANVSEGEFVFPADVVRYHGLDKMMALRQEAKMGLRKMESMGQMGNSEEATMSDDMPFDMADLIVVGGQGEPMQFAEGGFVPQTETLQTAAVPTMGGPTGNVTPIVYDDFAKAPVVTMQEYRNAAGETIIITSVNGKATTEIPAGYTLYTPPANTAPSTVQAAIQTANNYSYQTSGGGEGPDTPRELQVDPDYASMDNDTYFSTMERQNSFGGKAGNAAAMGIALAMGPLGLLTMGMLRADKKRQLTSAEQRIASETNPTKKKAYQATFTKMGGKTKEPEEENALVKFGKGFVAAVGGLFGLGNDDVEKVALTAGSAAADNTNVPVVEQTDNVTPTAGQTRPQLRPAGLGASAKSIAPTKNTMDIMGGVGTKFTPAPPTGTSNVVTQLPPMQSSDAKVTTAPKIETTAKPARPKLGESTLEVAQQTQRPLTEPSGGMDDTAAIQAGMEPVVTTADVQSIAQAAGTPTAGYDRQPVNRAAFERDARGTVDFFGSTEQFQARELLNEAFRNENNLPGYTKNIEERLVKRYGVGQLQNAGLLNEEQIYARPSLLEDGSFRPDDIQGSAITADGITPSREAGKSQVFFDGSMYPKEISPLMTPAPQPAPAIERPVTQTDAALGAQTDAGALDDMTARAPVRTSAFTAEPSTRTAAIGDGLMNTISDAAGKGFDYLTGQQSVNELRDQGRITAQGIQEKQALQASPDMFGPAAQAPVVTQQADPRDNIEPYDIYKGNMQVTPTLPRVSAEETYGPFPDRLSDSQLTLGKAINAMPDPYVASLNSAFGRSSVEDQTKSIFDPTDPSAAEKEDYNTLALGQTTTPETKAILDDQTRRQKSQKNITAKPSDAARTSKGTSTRKAAPTGDDRLSQANFLERALGITPAKVGARRGNDGVLYRTQADKREADNRQDQAKATKRGSDRAKTRREAVAAGKSGDKAVEDFNKANAADIGKRYGGDKEDGSDGPKIVCTEMYRQTQLVDWQHTMKIWHVYQEKHLTPYHQVGYHWLFKPYVRGMKNSSILTKLGAALAKHRTEHLRYILTKGKAKDNLIGNVWCKFVHPLVYIAGIIKEKIGK